MAETTTGISVIDEVLATVEKKQWEEAGDKKDPKPSDGRKPPSEGICKRCGEKKPINRLKLCYRCFVITNIEEIEKKNGNPWHPGDPHPGWCDCSLPEHTRMSSGN
jgi:hypothetical protein